MEYNVYGTVTISVMTKVEAESEKEAIEKAEQIGDLEFKSWTNDYDYEDTWIASDLDGEVQNISIE